MPVPFYVALFVLLFLLFIVVGYYALTLFNESEQRGARLRRVSHMLQKAELDTGVPYFTSLGNYLDVENPTMFLIAKRRTVFQPIVEEDEEGHEEQEEQEQEEDEEGHEEQEQEEQEQSPLDKTSESDQQEQQEQTSDEGEEVSDSSRISESSQVVPPPVMDLDQYVPLFQIHKKD